MPITEPYLILKNKDFLSHFQKEMDIEKYKIFDSVLEKKDINDAIVFITSFGLSSPAGSIGKFFATGLRQHCEEFLIEQLERLESNNTTIRKEVSLSLFMNPLFGLSLEKYLATQNLIKDGIKTVFALFSDSKKEKLIKQLLLRNLEIVRWSLASTLVLIMNYIESRKSKGITYNIDFIKRVSKYICIIYTNSNEPLDLFILDYSPFIYSSKIKQKPLYIVDIFEDNSYESIIEDISGPQTKLNKYFEDYAIRGRNLVISEIKKIS